MKIESYIDTIVADDSTNYELSIENYELYKDFKFISEVSSRPYEGPVEREVTFVSAGWNFMILFVVMILMVLNKFFAPQRFSSIITTLFQGGGEKIKRDNNSFLSVISFSVIVCFSLLLSMMIQKIFVIYGGNYILHENFNFFLDVVTAVVATFVFNYLFVLFYSWLFKIENLIVFHLSLHVSTMAVCNMFLIPLIMVLLFYPYRFLLIVSLVVLLIFFFIRFIKFLIEVRILSKLNFVNIFLYLCTAEILPVLVISKMIIMTL